MKQPGRADSSAALFHADKLNSQAVTRINPYQ